MLIHISQFTLHFRCATLQIRLNEKVTNKVNDALFFTTKDKGKKHRFFHLLDRNSEDGKLVAFPIRTALTSLNNVLVSGTDLDWNAVGMYKCYHYTVDPTHNEEVEMSEIEGKAIFVNGVIQTVDGPYLMET